MKDQRKQQWINDVLESTEGMTRATPAPFLYQKVKKRLTSQRVMEYPFLPRLAVAVSLLLIINGASILYLYKKTVQIKHEPVQNELMSEISGPSTYNY